MKTQLENALAFKPHLLDKEQEELVAKVTTLKVNKFFLPGKMKRQQM